MVIFGAITLLVLAVVDIALAEVDNSETFGAVALGFVIAGAVAMLAALMVVAIAYAARHGLLIARRRQGGGRAASLETGGAGLARPGPFGRLALRPAELLAPQPDCLGQLAAQPGRPIGRSDLRAVLDGCP